MLDRREVLPQELDYRVATLVDLKIVGPRGLSGIVVWQGRA